MPALPRRGASGEPEAGCREVPDGGAPPRSVLPASKAVCHRGGTGPSTLPWSHSGSGPGGPRTHISNTCLSDSDTANPGLRTTG